MYAPIVGRFTTEDPIGFDSGDSNFYRYVGNNPLVETDPSGLSALSKLIRAAIREASEEAIKRGIRDLLRREFYTRIGEYLAKQGARDLVQVHHLISRKFFGKSKPEISKFLSDIGTLQDASKNVTILPKRTAFEQGFDIGEAALHQGGHLETYYKEVEDGLVPLMEKFNEGILRAGTDKKAVEAVKEVAREGVAKVQATLRKRLQTGELRLQAYDTPELRRTLVVQIMALFIVAGLSVEEAEAATMEYIQHEVENESYYRQKNLFVRYGTAGYYTRDSDSKIARWGTFAVDFFNPVEDVIFFTDLIEDGVLASIDTLYRLDDVVSGSTQDIKQSIQTLRTQYNQTAFGASRNELSQYGPPPAVAPAAAKVAPVARRTSSGSWLWSAE